MGMSNLLKYLLGNLKKGSEKKNIFKFLRRHVDEARFSSFLSPRNSTKMGRQSLPVPFRLCTLSRPLLNEMQAAQVDAALHFGPPWQTCLTPFDQLYVLLFLPMKLRCDLVF